MILEALAYPGSSQNVGGFARQVRRRGHGRRPAAAAGAPGAGGQTQLESTGGGAAEVEDIFRGKTVPAFFGDTHLGLRPQNELTPELKSFKGLEALLNETLRPLKDPCKGARLATFQNTIALLKGGRGREREREREREGEGEMETVSTFLEGIDLY